MPIEVLCNETFELAPGRDLLLIQLAGSQAELNAEAYLADNLARARGFDPAGRRAQTRRPVPAGRWVDAYSYLTRLAPEARCPGSPDGLHRLAPLMSDVADEAGGHAPSACVTVRTVCQECGAEGQGALSAADLTWTRAAPEEPHDAEAEAE
jgi:hypothetical protein